MFKLSAIASVRYGLLGLLVMVLCSAAMNRHCQADEPRLFEQRIYTTHDGKLDALNARFRDHTCRLFEKHGMELIGFWVPTEGEQSKNTLIYILAYPDKKARDAAWEGFINDPEWKKAFAESRQDGPLVRSVESTFMSPTDYSKIK